MTSSDNPLPHPTLLPLPRLLPALSTPRRVITSPLDSTINGIPPSTTCPLLLLKRRVMAIIPRLPLPPRLRFIIILIINIIILRLLHHPSRLIMDRPLPLPPLPILRLLFLPVPVVLGVNRPPRSLRLPFLGILTALPLPPLLPPLIPTTRHPAAKCPKPRVKTLPPPLRPPPLPPLRVPLVLSVPPLLCVMSNWTHPN